MFENNVLASAKTIKIFFSISIIYTIIIIVSSNYSGVLYDFLDFIIYIATLLFFYLPEIIIFIIDFLIKKFKLQNQTIIKVIKIFVNIFNILYFIMLTFFIILCINFALDL